MTRTIVTRWQRFGYDVVGNEGDGYEVNDTYRQDDVVIRLKVKTANAGTAQEFQHASPSDVQIKHALDIRRDVQIATDGDDAVIYVDEAQTGYQIGELRLVSPVSLSPIRH